VYFCPCVASASLTTSQAFQERPSVKSNNFLWATRHPYLTVSVQNHHPSAAVPRALPNHLPAELSDECLILLSAWEGFVPQSFSLKPFLLSRALTSLPCCLAAACRAFLCRTGLCKRWLAFTLVEQFQSCVISLPDHRVKLSLKSSHCII